MANKIKCTCGHSWNKSDSSKKDVTVCHICGKNNMKDGGWLDKYDVPEAQKGISVSDNTAVKKPIIQNPVGFANDPDVIKYNKVKNDPSWGEPYKFLTNWYSDPETKKRLNTQGAPARPMTEALSQKRYDSYLDWLFASKDKNRKTAETIWKDDYSRSKELSDLLNQGLDTKYDDLRDNTTGFHISRDSLVALNSSIYPDKEKMYTTAVHELTHATPLDNFYVDYFKKNKPKNPSYSESQYFSENPTEIYPRIQDLRYQMWRDKKIAPGTRITPDMLDGYNNDSSENLRNYYSPEELSKIMNEIAYESNNKKPIRQAQNGIEGTMGGLTDKGFNYNGAWGGPSMAMGGSMPGAVGFTYERTGGIPSNGPYAKKTKASAQNGGEMKFYQEGLDWKPRNISQDGTYVKKPITDMLTMDEYRLKKALANQPVIQSPKGKQLTKEQILAKNKQTAEAQGKKFNPETGVVTPFLSPSTARTFERASENIVEPMIAMSPMGEVGMIRDVANLSKPFISGTANKLGVGAAKALFTAQKHLPAGIVKDNILGAAYGVRDISKGRPFFETFPITGKQKRSLETAQDKAFNEGLDFVKDWNYSNQGLDVNGMPILKIRPEVEARIESIYPDLYSSPTNINKISKGNPIFSAKNLLVNSRTIPLLRNKSLSDEAKNYIFKNRGTIGGFNMGATDESITLRNYGPYYNSPEDIKNVAAHELGHSMQKLGSVYGDDWGQQIAKYDYPNYKYQIPNTATPFGKQMGEAMVEPVKGEYTWEASPLEPHSELMVARMKAYDFYKSTDSEKVMQALQNPDDDLADWLIKNGDLNRFFKPTTSQEVKRKIIKGLPAAIPAIGIGAAATVDKKKKGGKVKKDDNGYWNPENWGEPVEIGSNNITMEGVYEPLLGVSDTGDTQMMYPGEDYKFKGKKVTEYPVSKKWLEKYK